jgi:hypothetical protein
VDPDTRLEAGGEVEVRAPLLLEVAEELIDLGHA